MLIAIFATVIAIIAITLFSQPATVTLPAVSMMISNQSGLIEISHDGGDSIPLADMAISVDDQPVPSSAWFCPGCGNDWSVGDTIQIDCSNPANCPTNTPNKINIIYKNAGQNYQILTTRYLWTMPPTPAPVTITFTATPTPTPTVTTTVTPVNPPVASFTANVTSGMAPLVVSFTDTTTNTPTGWSWNFSDGATSTVQNPVHTYTAAGTYNVTLTATNSAGSSTATPHTITVATPSSGSITLNAQKSGVLGFRRHTEVPGNRGRVFNNFRIHHIQP